MPGGTRKRHILAVEIECLDSQGQLQAQDRLLRWLDTFGYTAPGHGFEFKTIGVITGKQIGKPRVCEECGTNMVEPPNKICEGCKAYRDHTGQI